MSAYDDWRRGPTLRPHAAPPPAREVIPFIQAAVFLHHPDLVVELPEPDRRDLYGLPGNEAASGLTPITELFNGTPHPGSEVRENAVVGMMQLIGLRARPREAGQLRPRRPTSRGRPRLAGLARHPQAPQDPPPHPLPHRPGGFARRGPPPRPPHRRARDARHAAPQPRRRPPPRGSGRLRPRPRPRLPLRPGLAAPRPVARRPSPPSASTISSRSSGSLAEAVAYAHGKNVVHRGLNPRAVLVNTDRDGRLQVKVGDWQGVGRTDEATHTEATRGVTQLADVLAGEIPLADRWARAAFTAPEGIQVGTPDRLRLDVFSLGALAFYLVTGGQPPARNRADLTARLREQGGLDVSVELPAGPAGPPRRHPEGDPPAGQRPAPRRGRLPRRLLDSRRPPAPRRTRSPTRSTPARAPSSAAGSS